MHCDLILLYEALEMSQEWHRGKKPSFQKESPDKGETQLRIASASSE